MRLRTVAAIVVCWVLCLSGCLGGTGGPPAEYISVRAGNLGDCSTSRAEDADALVVGFRSISSLPGLERRAVMFADGDVKVASPFWYWEGTPNEVVGEYLGLRLVCSEKVRIIWPYRPRMGHDRLLTARLLRFEVDRSQSAEFRVALYLDMWGAERSEWVAGQYFERTVPVDSVDPEGIGRAANQAMDGLAEDVARWIEASAALAPRAKAK